MALVDVEIVGESGVPLTIAKAVVQAARATRARNRRDSYAARDEFWAVFDRDEHPRVPEAVQLCRQADVGIAF